MTLSSLTVPDPEAVTALAIAVFTLVLGIAANYFRPFYPSREKFLQQVSFIRQKLVEEVAAKHETLLNHARKIFDDVQLRGEGGDLVGEYAAQMFRKSMLYDRLDILKRRYDTAFSALFLAMLLAAVGLLVVLYDHALARYVFLGCLGIVILELAAICVLWWTSLELGECEDGA